MSIYLKELLSTPTFNEQLKCTIEHFEPGERIIGKGQKSQNVYLIVSGYVQVTTDIGSDKERRDSAIARLNENEIFGELSMFDDLPHDADVVAGEECNIAVIDSRGLMEFLERNPVQGFLVMRDLVWLLVKRMRQNNIRSKSLLSWYWQADND